MTSNSRNNYLQKHRFKTMEDRIGFWLGIALLILIPLTSFGKGKDKVAASVPGELVIRMKLEKNASAASTLQSVAATLAQKLNLKGAVKARSFKTDDSFAVISMPESQKMDSIELLKQDARVAYAEPNYLFHISGARDEAMVPSANSPTVSPNDEFYSQLWGMKNTGQADSGGQVGKARADINVEAAWNEGITGSRNIKVAVIDTGVDYTHPDLTANMWLNRAEIAGNGIDDDGNGFIDDVRGWNFAANTADPMDDHYHGTHCAGTIGASANNGIGVAGVAWNVTIVPIKFLSAQGSGSLEGAVQSIQYATRMGVNIMSNSWGGGPYTQSLYDVIEEARNRGITFIAAAGNDSSDNDARASYPASYQIANVISVAATDNRDRLATFSNYGESAVHVSAPGVKILSTVPAAQGSYRVLSGTSMATPHVAGIAVLMLSANPSATYAQIRADMVRTSDPVRALARKSVSGGRMNVRNVIHNVVPAPLPSPDANAWVDYAYTLDSPHPYVDGQTYTYPISVPGARYIRVVFERIDTETGYDFVTVTDGAGDEIENVSGLKENYSTDYLTGDRATIVLKSDTSVNRTGFRVSKLQVVY